MKTQAHRCPNCDSLFLYPADCVVHMRLAHAALYPVSTPNSHLWRPAP